MKNRKRMRAELRDRPPKFEVRAINPGSVEIRALPEDEGGGAIIWGLAIPYNCESEEMYGFREIVAPGAFKESLGGDIRCLWNHETGKPLGRTTNGTLTLRDAQEGLAYECKLPETSWGKDAKESISRGDVTGMSFGFVVRRDDWAYPKDSDVVVRTILEAELFEVSPVTFPAYPDSVAEARSKLLEEGKKKAQESREVPLSIYEKRLQLQKMIGGIN